MNQVHPLILVIEDDCSLRYYLRATLQSFGYRVEDAAQGKEGARKTARLCPDAVLLDLGLPDMDGLDLTAELRGWTKVPIIIVSARCKEEDKVRALDAGADDYLTKPFSSAELLARIRVVLRHSREVAETGIESRLEIGLLKVDFESRVITIEGTEIHLTPTEFKLLTILAKNAGKVITHRQLLHEVLGTPVSAQSTSTLRVHMASLRKKLERDSARPHLLLNEPGVGYRLQG